MDPDSAPWGMVLRDIIKWNKDLEEVMCHLSAARARVGRRGSQIDPPLPGGQALALRVPAADRTDPTSVVKDYALRLRRDLRDSVPLHRPMDGEARYMLGHLDDLRASSWAPVCWRDLSSVWRALGEATGYLREDDDVAPPRDPRSLADEVPDETLLTLAEADRFWPGVSGRVRTARSRGRRRKNPDGDGLAQPDASGRYLVADLRRWHLTQSAKVV